MQNNGVINAGTVGLSNSPGIETKSMGRIGPKRTFPERVPTARSHSDSLGEQQTHRAAQHRELPQLLHQLPAAAGGQVVELLRLPDCQNSGQVPEVLSTSREEK